MTGGDRILADRYRNKGTAFTVEERDRYGLQGLLPPAVEDLRTQLVRVGIEYDARSSDLDRHVYLRALQQRNSVLFYAFLTSRLEDVLPVVYTPTVGFACQQWSRLYRREHGLYLSWPDRHRVAEMLDNAIGDRDIDVVVATDGERILGLGDLGVGGMGIPIGKLALYTAGGGMQPSRTLPVMLDVGTNNEALLSDPLYLGWRHRRMRGDEYDELVDAFVNTLDERFPHVLLQWEDFAQANANRVLFRHRDRICSFNDDIQGTAAVTTAAIVAGMKASRTPISELRLVVVGAGSAGTGIAEQTTRALVEAGLTEDEARQRCWLVDRFGLLHDGLDDVFSFQQPFVRPWSEIQVLDRNTDGQVDLLEVVTHVRPHALVGVTGQPGLFTEEVIRAQAAGVDRPIVLPLSNPTPRAEAIPSDVIAWTDGRALIGTGSPFDPVISGATTYPITQVNNVYIFPGLGLGVTAVKATAVTDAMLTAAATAIGEMDSIEVEPNGALLPPISETAAVAVAVAIAVGAAAVREGVAPPMTIEEIAERVEASFWHPVYT